MLKAGAVTEEDPPGEASVSLRPEEDEEADFIGAEDVETEFQVHPSIGPMKVISGRSITFFNSRRRSPRSSQRCYKIG